MEEFDGAVSASRCGIMIFVLVTSVFAWIVDCADDRSSIVCGKEVLLYTTLEARLFNPIENNFTGSIVISQ